MSNAKEDAPQLARTEIARLDDLGDRFRADLEIRIFLIVDKQAHHEPQGRDRYPPVVDEAAPDMRLAVRARDALGAPGRRWIVSPLALAGSRAPGLPGACLAAVSRG